MIDMPWAWDKEKILSPWQESLTHDLLNTGQLLYPLSHENSWRARSLIHLHISLPSLKFTIFINLSNLRYIVYILYIFIAIRDVGDIVKEMFGDSPPSIVMMGHR